MNAAQKWNGFQPPALKLQSGDKLELDRIKAEAGAIVAHGLSKGFLAARPMTAEDQAFADRRLKLQTSAEKFQSKVNSDPRLRAEYIERRRARSAALRPKPSRHGANTDFIRQYAAEHKTFTRLDLCPPLDPNKVTGLLSKLKSNGELLVYRRAIVGKGGHPTVYSLSRGTVAQAVPSQPTQKSNWLGAAVSRGKS